MMNQMQEHCVLSDTELDAIAGAVGGSGSDTLWALSPSGTDTLQGGAGNDTLYSIVGGWNRFQRNNLGLFTLDIGTTENL